MFIELHRASDGNPFLIKAENILFVAMEPENHYTTVGLDFGVGEVFKSKAKESYNSIKMMLTDRLVQRTKAGGE